MICERLADDGSLRSVCKADDMPSESTVRRWALENRDGFSAQYARARELGYQSMAEDILDIADETSFDTKKDQNGNESMDAEFVARSRLRVDARKWLLSKALPKVFGDKVALTGGGEDDPAIKVIQRIERVIVDAPKSTA